VCCSATPTIRHPPGPSRSRQPARVRRVTTRRRAPEASAEERRAGLYLPKSGWGRIVLSAWASRAGRAWTDEGIARQERGLKHRADNETRTIPIPPVLVRLLRVHIKRFGTTPDGRIFQTARGGILQDSGYNEIWDQAR
jgi:hypothetical protein